MNKRQLTRQTRIVVSVATAFILGFAAYVILMGLSAAPLHRFPFPDYRDPAPVLAQDTYTYTIFLPIMLKNLCQSVRPPLQGTANFAGKADIQTPENCTTGIAAEIPILATGAYTDTPANATIWVLAYAPNGLYYPQSPDACLGLPPYQDGGIWQVPVYLGLKGGDPEWFDIVVILTDQAASQFLSNTVKRGCQLGQYQGIPAVQLNQMAITEKAYITVQTLD